MLIERVKNITKCFFFVVFKTFRNYIRRFLSTFRQKMYFCSVKSTTDVKQQIIAASKEAFKRYGFTKIAMEDIAKASGKSRSTLYHYFKNKTEVFDAVMLDILSAILALASKQIQKNKNLKDNLWDFQLVKLNELKLLIDQFEHVVSDIRVSPEILNKITHVLKNEEISLVYQILVIGIENGDVAEIEAAELDFLARSLVLGMRNLEVDALLFGNMVVEIKQLERLVLIIAKGLK